MIAEVATTADPRLAMADDAGSPACRRGYVSRAAIEGAENRLRASLPRVDVQRLVMTHEQALGVLPGVEPLNLVLFIGSSVGRVGNPSRSRGSSGAEGPFGRHMPVGPVGV